MNLKISYCKLFNQTPFNHDGPTMPLMKVGDVGAPSPAKHPPALGCFWTTDWMPPISNRAMCRVRGKLVYFSRRATLFRPGYQFKANSLMKGLVLRADAKEEFSLEKPGVSKSSTLRPQVAQR
jgi:hypothetical protein